MDRKPLVCSPDGAKRNPGSPSRVAPGLRFAPSRATEIGRCGMTSQPQQFASDNYSGICPEAWTAMADANRGHAPAYGDDLWTAKASDAFRALFETNCEVFFAFNGT